MAGIILCFVLVSVAFCQQHIQNQPVTPDQQLAKDRMWLDMMQAQNNAVTEEVAKRNAAKEALHQFTLKFNDFAILFNKLGDKLKDGGVFDLKRGTEVEKSWHKLITDPGWLHRKDRSYCEE